MLCENRTSTPRIRKINKVQAIPVGMSSHITGTELLLVLSGQSPTTIAQMGRWSGFGAWRCNLGDVSSSADGEFAPKEGFLDALKPSLLKALPNHAMGGGACLEDLGANVGLSN